jgi:hypothetical protein
MPLIIVTVLKKSTDWCILLTLTIVSGETSSSGTQSLVVFFPGS